jgi:hypothetical protein
VAAEQDLVQEMGEEAAARLMFEAKGTLGLTDGVDYLAHSRRIYVVAQREFFRCLLGSTSAILEAV